MKIIKNGEVYTKDFTFKKVNIILDGDTIVDMVEEDHALEKYKDARIIDAEGLLIIPGLVDVHFHGCVGYDFCDGTIEAISSIAEFQKKHGVAAICPATMTLPKERLMAICKNASEYKKISANEEGKAKLKGIHLEGPFISKDRVGAQNPKFVHVPDVAFLQDLINESGDLVKLTTIAPETEGAIRCINELKDKIRFSIGHTVADYDIAMKAYAAGAKHATHLYNAMTGLNHRDPGVVGAARDNKDVTVELICDGIHIHPSVVRATFKMFGRDRVILISDSMRACGMEDGEYELGGLPVIKKGNEARLRSGELAGSVTNVYDCMVKAIEFGIRKEDAIKAATYNPAKAIGILDEFGSIEVGKTPGLVLVNSKFEIENVI